jgi:hypothetical protein
MDIRADDRALVVTDPRNDVRAPSCPGSFTASCTVTAFRTLTGTSGN